MYADIGQGILAGIVVDIIDLPLFVHGVRRGFWFGAHFRNFGIYCGWLLVRRVSGAAVPTDPQMVQLATIMVSIVFFKIVHYCMVKSKLLTHSI